MTDSHAPQLPSSNPGLKYALIGGVLVAGALALLFCGDEEETESPIALAIPDAGPPPTTQFEPEFELAPAVEDQGPPDAGPAERTARTGMRAARSCEGSIPTSALRQAVSRYNGQVRQCYERALKQNNMLQGRVTVSLTIGSGGRVERANASSSLGSAVNACVTSAARGWRLVAPTGGTCAEARVPFNMTPGR